MYHPRFPFGAGGSSAAPVTESVLSIRIKGVDLDALSPAPFVAVQVSTVKLVSLLSVVSLHPEVDAMPDSGSNTVQSTNTFSLFHPEAFAGGDKETNITGGVLSMMIPPPHRRHRYSSVGRSCLGSSQCRLK